MDPSSSARIRVEACVYADDDHAIALMGNVALSYSRATTNPNYLKSWTELMDRLEPPILVLTVIDSAARAPSAEAKEAIRASVTRHQERIGAFAYTVEGEGFGAAAIRSALALMNLAARYPFPQRVFATPNEAVPWLVQQLPQALRQASDPARVVQTVDAIRAELRQRAAERAG